jgi:hypothetical protein
MLIERRLGLQVKKNGFTQGSHESSQKNLSCVGYKYMP